MFRSVNRFRTGDEFSMVAAEPSIGDEVGVDPGRGLEREREDSREIHRSLNPENVRVRTIDVT